MKCYKRSFIYFAILILMINLVLSQGGTGSESEIGAFPGESTSDPQQFQQNLQNALQSGGSVSGVTNRDLPINLPNGEQATVRGNVRAENRRITADFIRYRNSEFQNGEGFQATQDGYIVDKVRQLNQDGTTLIAAEGVEFRNGVLTAKHADSFIKTGSITTNINDLNAKQEIFSVNKADSFLSDCIRVDNIKDSEFKVSNIVEITTKSNVNLKITDCSYNEVTFSGKGKVSMDKSSDNPKYIVENGTLTKKEDSYNETVESNNSIIIETDKTFGFKCLTITPVGSYFYNDNDLRKDFVIHIPKESSTYKLCLRKNQVQRFADYNGLVDFINKKIELNGIVNYLKYSFKDKQLLSLLSDFVYQSFDLNDKATFNLDKDFLFVNDLSIDNKNPNDKMSISNSGYHEIIEVKGTRFVKISRAKFYPELIKQYKTDFESPIIEIKNQILAQNGNSKVKILSVNSPDVKKAELFLQNYWDRNKNIKLSEYLE